MPAMLHTLARTIRNLARAPQFTIPALLVLALGIGGTTAVFGALRTTLFQALPYRHPERIVNIWWAERADPGSNVPASWPLFEDLKGRLRGTEAIAGLVNEDQVLTGAGEPEEVLVGGVTPDFFRVFDVKPLIGTLTWTADTAQGAVLSEPFWRKHFGGDLDILGRSLVLNGVSYPILGVLPAQVRLQGKDIFIPYRPGPGEHTSRYDCYMPVYARLKPGVSAAAFKAELQSVDYALGEAYGGMELKLQLHFAVYQDQLRSEGKDLGQLLLMASGVLLLMAIVNLAGQFLLRSLGRTTDTAVCMALGATPLQAIRASLAESLLVSVAGALLGLGVAGIGLRLLSPLVPATLLASHPMRLDWGLLGFALASSLGVSLILSAVPGALLGRLHLTQALKAGGRTQAGRGSRRARTVLAALQAGLALALLAGFGLLSRSLIHLHHVDLGMNPKNLAVFEIAPPQDSDSDTKRLEEESAQLVHRLRSLPGVVAAGSVSLLPVEDSWVNYTPRVHGQALPEGTWIELRTASSGLFDALGVRLLRGRTFTGADMGSGPWTVAIVSRSAARLCWPGQDPLGQQLTDSSGSNWCTVVGVVDDIRNAGPKDASGLATVYFPSHLGFGAITSYAIRTNPGLPLPFAAIRHAVRETMPGVPVLKLRSMEDVLDENLQQDLTLAQLLGFAGAIALVLTLVGLYGVMSHSVITRTREFAVRLALGAQPRHILALILREELHIVLVGIALGLGLAVAGSGAMAHLIYGIHPLDPLSLAASALILLAGALAVGFIPALRAARIQPADGLRRE